MRKKLPSLKSLEKKLDKIFSEYIRKRDCNVYVFGRCCTCKRVVDYKECHAGHFIKRQYKSVRYDERNVHAQCPACNVFKGGCQDEYSQFIIDKYGMDTFIELMRLKHQPFKPDRGWYLEKIEEFKSKLEELNV